MKKQIENIYKYLVSVFHHNSNNLGLLAFGSASRGQEDKNSDIDFYVLTKNKPQHYRENFIYKNQRVDVLFDSIEDIEKYLKSEKNSLRRPVASMIYNSVVLLDKSKVAKKLKLHALTVLKSKVKYSKTEILMHKYSLDDFLGEAKRDLENNNELAFTLDAQLIIDNSLELFCKVNNIILIQPRDMLFKLSIKDKKFAKLMLDFSRANNNHSKLKLLIKIVDYTYKISGGGLPNKWSI